MSFDYFFHQLETVALSLKRDLKTIRVLGVTKGKPVEAWDKVSADIRFCGVGESRLQEMMLKMQMKTQPLPRIEFIGHLQRNKLKKIAEYSSRIQSITSVQQLSLLNDWVSQFPQRMPYPVLLEMNASEEAYKTGAKLDLAPVLLEHALKHCPYIQVQGLMTMAGLNQDPAFAFEKLKNLQITLENDFSVLLPELSMGMSADYPVALKYGSTLIRIGSALWS